MNLLSKLIKSVGITVCASIILFTGPAVGDESENQNQAINESHDDHDHDEHDHDEHDHENSGPLYTNPEFPGAQFYTDDFLNSFIWSEALYEPEWIDGQSADFMRDDDYLLGLIVGDDKYAIPWWKMDNHHVANLTFDDNAYLITFCEACASASAFIPIVDGERLNFRIRGIYNGTHFIEDAETNSYWTPFTAISRAGKLKGTTLERYPLFIGEWGNWLSLYPDTRVAFGQDRDRKGHGSTRLPGVMESAGHQLFSSIEELDPRLPPSTLVFGVNWNDESVAFELDTQSRKPTIYNTSIGGHPVAVLNETGSLISIAYSREVDGKVLEFHDFAFGQFSDTETNSIWGLDGVAVSGQYEGQRLRYIPSRVEEWYAWAANHPDTEIFSEE